MYGIPKSLLSTHFSPRQNLEKSAEGFENLIIFLRKNMGRIATAHVIALI